MNYVAVNDLDVLLMMSQKPSASSSSSSSSSSASASASASSLNKKDQVVEAMEEFHKNVVILSDGSKVLEAPLAPAAGFEGISHIALIDWSRCGVKIGNQFYRAASSEGKKNIAEEGDFSAAQDMAAADKQLIALCNGDSSFALWLSSFANQQIFVPFGELFEKLPIKLIGNNYLNVNSGDISFAFSELEDGAVRLDVGYQWDSNRAAKIYLYQNADRKMDFIIRSDSQFSANFSLRFDFSEDAGDEMPVVSVLEPLKYNAQIFMVQIVEEVWEMLPGDNSEIEIFTEETRKFGYFLMNAGSLPEDLDQDGQMNDELVRAVLMGVNESPSLGPEG